MKDFSLIAVIFLIIVFAAVPVIYFYPLRSESPIQVYSYQVVTTYPHDPLAFTEGLIFTNGTFIESTGLFGNSSLRVIVPETGKIIRMLNLSEEYFGEGVTSTGDTIIQLTYDTRTGFLYDDETLEQKGVFHYPTQGWGITWDGTYLIMSDGSSSLYYLDPMTFERVRELRVHANGEPVIHLNELEYVDGEIFANVWMTDRIARISPETGDVAGWIDLRNLLPPEDEQNIGWAAITGGTNAYLPLRQEACLNGIAYDPDQDRLFVTGKLWPKIFEITLIPTG